MWGGEADEVSPVVHVRLAAPQGDAEAAEAALQVRRRRRCRGGDC